MTIRPFTPDDYPAMTAIANAAFPEYPETEKELRFGDSHREAKCRHARWMVERDGQVVAFGEYDQRAGMYHPRKFVLDIMVLPEQHGRGFGRALYEHLLDALQPFDPLSVRGHTREDMARSMRFLQDRGFVEDMRSFESRLDVAAFDFAPYEQARRRLREEGVEIRTLTQIQSDADWEQKLYEQHLALMADVPSPEPHTPVSFTLWREQMNNPNLLPDGFLVAVHGGEYIAKSVLWGSQGNSDLYTGLTGVRRDWRRKGIALALKLQAIAFARERGYPLIKTWNETNNRAMLSINEMLGFVKQPAWIDFVKVLKEEHEPA